MSRRVRVWFSMLLAGLLAVGVAACGTSRPKSSGTLSTTTPVASANPITPAPSASATGAPTPAPTVTVTKTATVAKALTCNQIKYAYVGSKTISYNGYHDSIPLGGGVWSGEDGNTVTLQDPCAIGDLDGDTAADAVGVVVLTSGGSGQFYTLVVWHNKNHSPEFWALADLGDRNPVTQIAISGEIATVKYCTRTSDQPMVVLNVSRTATYKLSGHTFVETGHTDVSGDCTV